MAVLLRRGNAISSSLAVTGGGLCIAVYALLQLQLGSVDGLLVPEVRLDALLMPLAHPPVAR